MADDEIAEVRATLARLGLAETELGAVGATLARPLPTQATARLPRLSVGAADDELVPRHEIGRGGMGVVQLAEQRSLAREVALKTARAGDALAARALVREARVTGALEHPNLVPVHALGVGPDQAPILVMKRVAGVTWRALLDDRRHPAWADLTAGHGDPLRSNVEILMQLCRALSFAHERGYVHRDLKPDNVMVGTFGEVTLLDWGVAIHLDERASEPKTIVGTPGYLAPEMARGDPALVEPRSDVYLLGAVLYEVLSGRMPHQGPHAMAALASSLSGSLAPLPDDAPVELAELVRRAMALDPNARVESAEAFRQSLAHFLAARDADRLVDAARQSLERADREIESNGPASAAAFRALIEARFGLSSAREMRPRDESIQRELERVTCKLVQREIALGSLDAARSLAAELSDVPAELARALDELEQQLGAERRAREEAEASRRQAASRSALGPLTAIWVVGSVVGNAAGAWTSITSARERQPFPKATAITLDLVGLAIGAVGLLIWRRRLFATRGTRRLTFSYTVWGFSLVLSDLVTYSRGGDIYQAGLHSLFASGAVAAAIGMADLPDVLPAVLVHALAIGLALTWPAATPNFVMVALALDAVIFLRAFRRHAAQAGAAGSEVVE